MKYLFLCHSLNVGGIETYILRFARWMLKLHPEHQLHIACKSGQFGSYETEFRKLGIILHSLPMGYLNPIPCFRLYYFLKFNRYDAICDFGGDFGAFPTLVAYACKIPKRLVFYRSARNAYKPALYKRYFQHFLNCLVLLFSTKILSNSQDAIDYYFTDYPVDEDRRFHVVRNGVPVIDHLSLVQKEAFRQELGVRQGQKIVLHVGSGRWEKNHACMLQIAKHVQDNGDDILFCFVGPGVESAHGAKAKQMALKNVNFLGERRDVDHFLQIADVFLFPSLSEGQPNALLEAMTNGVPFIASDIAPVRESLSPEWGDRWLFDPDNPVQGYLLLQEHLNTDFRCDSQFKALVSWCHDVYNEDTCFGIFLNSLSTRPMN
jgi:glycosyltransferase involved in cell wall biosynthesis